MGPYHRARKVSGSGSFRSWSGEAAHSVQSWAVSWNPVALRLLLAPGAGVLRFGGHLQQAQISSRPCGLNSTIWLSLCSCLSFCPLPDHFKSQNHLSQLLKFMNILPRWLSGKESACNAGDSGSSLGQEDSPGEGKGNPLQYSCLGNPMDRGPWWAIVHWVTTESDMTD